LITIVLVIIRSIHYHGFELFLQCVVINSLIGIMSLRLLESCANINDRMRCVRIEIDIKYG